MKICPVEAELFQKDSRDEADSRFSQFANATKNVSCIIENTLHFSYEDQCELMLLGDSVSVYS
jgi:hypothetical protein